MLPGDESPRPGYWTVVQQEPCLLLSLLLPGDESPRPPKSRSAAVQRVQEQLLKKLAVGIDGDPGHDAGLRRLRRA